MPFNDLKFSAVTAGQHIPDSTTVECIDVTEDQADESPASRIDELLAELTSAGDPVAAATEVLDQWIPRIEALQSSDNALVETAGQLLDELVSELQTALEVFSE